MRLPAYAAILLLPLAGTASCQLCHSDQFESQEPTAALYSASPFLHGYRDGYQQGFHDSDLEMQLSHSSRGWATERNYRKVKYNERFGDRDSYVLGYRSGYKRGFDDMVQSCDFRAFALLERAAPADAKQIASSGENFDQGVRDGYVGKADSCPAASGYCVGLRTGVNLAQAERQH